MPLIDTAEFLPGPGVRALYRPFQPFLERLLGFRAVERLYQEVSVPGRSPPEFARAALAALDVSWTMADEDKEALAAVPGPMVVCSNHPCGPLEPLALMSLLADVRGADSFVLANRILSAIPELRAGIIPVEPLWPEGARRSGVSGNWRAVRHLRRDRGTVLVFPAGRVSGWSRKLGAVCDRPWPDAPVQLASLGDASLACVHVEGLASRLFLSVPNHWASLRALLLVREFLHAPSRRLTLRLSRIFTAEENKNLLGQSHPGARLRAFCYLGMDRALVAPKPPPSPPADTVQTSGESGDRLAGEIARLKARGHELAHAGAYSVSLFRGDESEPLLEEIGRLRERTFQAAGQGTGREIDLSPEDSYYHHLILWDRTEERVTGAYRIGFTEDHFTQRKREELYLQPLFRFPAAFYRKIGPAMELSRSFIVPSRQRDGRALSALWRGLAAAAQVRRCHTFYGCVTISNDFHPASRAILVDFLDSRYPDSGDILRLVFPRNPFRPLTHYHSLWSEVFAGERIDALRPVIEEIEKGHRTIPPLIRYYCSLGARFLAFHTEASFNDAVYCLLRVDIEKIDTRYKNRFGLADSRKD